MNSRPNAPVLGSCVRFYDIRQYKIAQTYGTLDDSICA
ncbi:hypothetical protein PC116_g33462 [Phytophthora cactorum]|nr:hypothetical protein PC116_g33462 [Phytophthora cactorum]